MVFRPRPLEDSPVVVLPAEIIVFLSSVSYFLGHLSKIVGTTMQK